MIKNNYNKVLVPGRAGELTNIVNPLTFSLLELIFRQNGPYRKVLKNFGVPINDVADNYIHNIDGKVYSDLNAENRILWSNLPYQMVEIEHKVIVQNNWHGNTVKKLYNYIKKLVKETYIILHINSYVKNAEERYERFSNFAEKLLATRKLSSKTFLEQYEHIVYITYLYELLYTYNGNTADALTPKDKETIKQYIKTNDYLLQSNPEYIELTLKPNNGFFLEDFENIKDKLNFKVSTKKFIPKRVPDLVLDDLKNSKLVAAEKKLQCLKNNIRLKTNILLYFLNFTLDQKIKNTNLKNYTELSISDIEK